LLDEVGGSRRPRMPSGPCTQLGRSLAKIRATQSSPRRQAEGPRGKQWPWEADTGAGPVHTGGVLGHIADVWHGERAAR
jgi:hypothetical protein